MKIISIGDLVTDYYYKNNKLVGVNGGMTSHNIIANISKLGFNTSVYGVCGNDMAGKIAIDISKPTYSEDAMNIYFYKGNL